MKGGSPQHWLESPGLGWDIWGWEALVHPACSPGGTGEKLLPSCLLAFLQKA